MAYAARGDTARAAFHYESMGRQLVRPATAQLAAAAEEAARYVGSSGRLTGVNPAA